MRRPGGGCPVDGLVGEMFNIGKEFIKDRAIKKRFGMEASNIVKNVFEDVQTEFEAISGIVSIAEGWEAVE